jgi:hypothetical protein
MSAVAHAEFFAEPTGLVLQPPPCPDVSAEAEAKHACTSGSPAIGRLGEPRFARGRLRRDRES